MGKIKALFEKGKHLIKMARKADSEKDLQPHFLPDAPLPADKEKDAAFGHDSIASNLAKIIQLCPSPFTIGLFGKWGTGKTTVINLLISKLQSSRKPIVVAKVDAWKYEEDSLRRQLLITLDDELGLGLKYKDELNQTLTEADPTKGKIKYDLGLLLNTAGVIALSSVLVGFILKLSIPTLTTVASDLLIQFGLFGFLTQFILSLFRRVGVTITEHRTDSAEGFERKFKEDILSHTKLKGKRLLIIIDNLDRCSHSKAVELLSTIKTFLAKDETEQSDCVFLITCDDEAIKQHIKSVYLKENDNNASGAFDVDEFLRKFFNAFIRIPTFIDTELQSYTEKLLKETNVPQLESNDLAYVITTSFRENPRQIKQFINTLLAHFLLAKEREESSPSLMPEGTVTGNVAFLAKLLIIRQRFPMIYRKIEEEHLTVDEMVAIALPEGTKEELQAELKEFNQFLRATKTITVTDIRPFIHLKQSAEELAIPGSKELELALIDNKPEIVSEKFKSIKADPKQLTSLKRFLPDLIGRNAGRKQLLLNIVSCSLESLKQHNILLGDDFYDKVGDVLTEEGELKGELQAIEPVLIFNEVLTRCDTKYKRVILDHYIGLFAPQGESPQRLPVDYASKLLEQFISHKDWIQSRLSDIKKAMVQLYFAEAKLLVLLKDKPDSQREFLTEETPSKLAETLSDQDVENKESLKEKASLYISFRGIANPAAASMFLKLATQLVSNENQKTWRDAKETLFGCFTDVLAAYEELIKQLPDKDELNRLSDAGIQSYGKISDWSQKRIVVPFLLALARLDSAKAPSLETQVQNFFSNTDLPGIQYIMNPLTQDRQQEIIRRYEPAFKQRVQQDQNIFDFLHERAPAEVGTQWLNNLIGSSHYERGLKKLDELKFKIDDPKVVVEKLLSQVQSAAESHKRMFYNAVNQMACADNAELKSLYCSQLKALFRSGNATTQETGLLALQGAGYLPEMLQREVTRDTVEWLGTLNPSNALQSHAIKSVLVNWKRVEIEKPIQRNYIDFVFDKLIKRASSIDNIRFGFEILVELEPGYEEYKPYFDDVYTKIESEGNDQIKAELISGLSKLKPKERNSKDKAFWDKVEKLSE